MRNWYDPREGLAAFRAPIDYALAAAFGVGNFALCGWGYWRPPDRIFDEVYFARAAHEYLTNQRIYENTHPPLSKLLITASVLLFGGVHKGESALGWRFLDVCFASLAVVVLYALAKRITGSTAFACLAAALFTVDGMHFVQARIATPESFVGFFAIAALYALYRFWIASQVARRAFDEVPWWGFAGGIVTSLCIGSVVAFAGYAYWRFDAGAIAAVTAYVACGTYVLVRCVGFPRLFGNGWRETSFAEGSRALEGSDGFRLWTSDGSAMLPGGRRHVLVDGALRIRYGAGPEIDYQTPDGSATYGRDGVRSGDAFESGSLAPLWGVLFAVSLGCLISTKWYGVTLFGLGFGLLAFVWFQPAILGRRPTLWGNPHAYHLDAAIAALAFASATVYGLSWVPDLLRQSPDPTEIHTVNDVVDRQYAMFEYHDVYVRNATHPYSSKWWEWPLDVVPVAYYYQDRRRDQSDAAACCIYEVTSMPNPIVLWFGLLCVPAVGFIGWRERRKGYVLVAAAYLAQWLPWAASPRLAWEYHFYVNVPLVCLCDAIVLQRFWLWGRGSRHRGNAWMAAIAAAAFLGCAAAAFAFFYPVLAAQPLDGGAWHARMWFPTWIIGPG